MERRFGVRAALSAITLLVFAGVVIGCSDSEPSADGGALPMCASNDGPINHVVVLDSSYDPSEQDTACPGAGLCQPRQLQGVVSSAGRGFPPDAILPESWKASETRWINIADGDHVWIVASRSLPDFAVREGSAVSASYFLLHGGVDTDRTALELRVGGKLAFYYGMAGSVDDLQRPRELAIARRAATCTVVANCFMFSQYDLEMSLNGSKPVMLGTGESKVVSDYELKNFLTEMSTGPRHCPDGFMADITVLAARTSPLSEQPTTLDAGLQDDGGYVDAGDR